MCKTCNHPIGYHAADPNGHCTCKDCGCKKYVSKKTKKFKCCGGELIHELDCKPTVKEKVPKTTKKVDVVYESFNDECGKCGRIYCDHEYKY